MHTDGIVTCSNRQLPAASGGVPAAHRRAVLSPVLVFVSATVAAVVTFGAFSAVLRSRGALFTRGDPVGYYVYLRSLVHDHDLEFTNDYGLFQPSADIPGPNLGRIDATTGRPDNNYTVGQPLLVAPIYAAGNAVFAPFYGTDRGGARFPLFLDQLIFSYGALLVGVAGIWVSFRFVCLYFPERESLLATIAFWLCSPLLYYIAREPFQSHAASVFAVSLFLYVWRAPSRRPRLRWILIGAGAALVLMARQQDGVILLVPAGAALVHDGWRRCARTLPTMLPFISVGFIPLFAIQMLVWHTLRGSFVSYAYRGQEFEYLTRPYITAVLFSSNHGVISWHPIIAVCLLGLALLSIREYPVIGRLALVCFAAQLYMLGAWWCWWMGNSFGHRGFLGLTPLFILGLAAVLARLTHRWTRRLSAVGVASLCLWNVVLLFAYLSEMIPYEGDFSWWTLVTALPHLPARILAKVGSL